MAPHDPSIGLLLIGHGTRDAAGRAEFTETVRLVAASLPEFRVEAAFLELAEPGIPQGIERLVASRVDAVVVQPLLLFAAGHAKRDVPLALAEAGRRHVGVRFRLTEPLGCHPTLLQLSGARFREALARSGLEAGGLEAPADAGPTTLIVAGRGSSDAEATVEAQRYARELAALVEVTRCDVAFMAAAQPRLPQVLAEAARDGSRTVVVLPHLLFQGDVLHQLRAQVAECARAHPGKRWLVAAHLGPTPQLVEALVQQVQRASSGWLGRSPRRPG